MKANQLNYILNNNTLGSSELVKLLNKYLLSIRTNHLEIISTIKQVRKKLGHFEAVNTYLNELNPILKRNSNSQLLNFLKGYLDKEKMKIAAIFKHIYPSLKKKQSVITLSRSGTMLEILKLLYQKNKKLKAVVCESRPKLEGRLMAEALADIGIKVELITDAMMGLYINKVDAAIIGADIVLKNGNMVNKVGSKALALFCREYKKPFYVLTTKSKFSESNRFKPKKENPKEILNKKVKNLSAGNYYLEEIDKSLITKIFTD